MNSKTTLKKCLTLMLAFLISTGSANADYIFGEPVNLGPPVNSSASECFSTISYDGLELYFMDPFGPVPGGLGGWDIWVVTRSSVSEPWGAPINPGPPINSESDDAKPSISADGLTLYFGSTQPGGQGGYDLWVSTRATITDDWSEPENLGETINGPFDEAFPCISKDGLELYFSGFGEAGRPGGYGDADIWVTRRATTDDPWGEPVNLGETINSTDYDSCPYLSSSGLVLFFHSLRDGGPGQECMWVSTRSTTSSDDWSTAELLPTPINSTYNQGVAGVSADDSTFYFASNRTGGEGFFDIWQAQIFPVVDLNGDRVVNSADICIIVENWGQSNPLCDIGPTPLGDGIVDVHDLVVLAEHLFEDYRLIAHWKLDEEAGDTAHDSLGEYDGTLQGEPVWKPTSGQLSGALDFDGIDDYASIPFVLNPGDISFSIITWIKGGASGQVVISQADKTMDTPIGSKTDPGSTWLGTTSTDGSLRTGLSELYFGPLESESVVTDGQWHHIGLVYDRTIMRRYLYVDGTEVAVDSDYVAVLSCDAGLYIGAGQALDAASFFSGLIDDVRIYDVALSADEIAVLAQ
jgi:hypothetical protein